MENVCIGLVLLIATTVLADSPCHAPHPLVSQNHVAPRTPHIALLALVYSDVSPAPTPSDVKAWFDGPASEYIDRVSRGCTSITYTAFVVQVPDSETACLSQADMYKDIPLPAIPGYNPADFYATIVTPVKDGCGTSATTGSTSLTIDGTLNEITAIFMSMYQGDANPKNQLGEVTGFKSGQSVYVHELIHLFGAGYHSNAFQCTTPDADMTDVLKCPSYEYGDLFDILGTSQSHAFNLNARLRYNFGWLGADDIAVVSGRGTHALSPLNNANKGSSVQPTKPVAAVLAQLGIWLEWRDGMDTVEGGAALEANSGFFVRRYQTLIDANQQSCEPWSWDVTDSDSGDYGPNPERLQVTLNPGRTFLLRSQGALLQADPAGLDTSDNTLSFSAHFTGSPPPCVRAAPNIAVGMVGEWLFCDTPDRKDGKCDFEDNVGMAILASYNRKTRHMINGLSNRDSVGCGGGAASFTVQAASTLPSGWGFAAEVVSAHEGECVDTNYCGKAGYDMIGGGVSFGIPDDAADGDYDVCITATNDVSGLMAAKILRVTLPEGGNEWYSNNRPGSYANVDATLAASCAAMNGACAAGYPGCVVPRTDNCKIDQQCTTGDSGDANDDMSGYGHCWATAGGGTRVRGHNFADVSQSFCIGGPALLESEPCSEPLKAPCADQQTCTVGSEDWVELKKGGESCMCAPAWTGLCEAGQPGANDPVCDQFDAGGGGSIKWFDRNAPEPCFNAHPPYPEDGWNAPATLNAQCLRELCETSELCGGYMLKDDLTNAYLYGTSILAGYTNPTNPHTCWAKPVPPESSCTCLRGPVVKSEGCSQFKLAMEDQWVGDVCPQTTPPPNDSNCDGTCATVARRGSRMIYTPE